ncbi:sialate O-acetylesterase [Emticicia sp. BO119]|uniref:sialate O-acetylesterase n=1 Tax=Emticicia sp. BO119 TaxID=2757768 RepID=UPI0015F0A566|nr:sialate O-acetylesterase [Emticicia sp. BO119]MBA4849693.1 T9SS type A sorting domain-containing protein [Emticicia sp. BO119]
MKKILVGFFLLAHSSVFGQLMITFPMNRAVFQRNNSGGGVIPIAGTFQTRVDRIDARLVSIKGGSTVDWIPISVNPNFGSFSGGIYAVGGWYRLEVRAIRDNNVIHSVFIEKVGLGEVFLIAGQSNAQGYEGRGNPPALDDRVNVITNFYSYGQITEVPFPVIGHLDENIKLAPLGNGSWCWGKLGDLLAAKLDVPIMFFNAAFEALGIEEWSRSADGEAGKDFYSGNYAKPGYPFENIRKSMHNYSNMFGVRAILWHQGETDNDKGTSFDVYKNALQYVIQRSRNDSGRDVSWMVSKVSRTRRGTSQTIIEAQRAVIREYPNVFNGPDTDDITHRSDGVHFESFSLLQLAEAWSDRLNQDFFIRSNPVPASSPLFFQMYCSPDNSNAPLTIFMPDGFKEYYWTNGFGNLNNNSSIQIKNGFFRGKAVDYIGNVYYTAGVNYVGEVVPDRPSLTAEGATEFCQGGSVRLTSSTDQEISWSTGEYGKSIMVSQPGYYVVNRHNYLGCFNTSNGVNITVYPNPEAKIVAEGPTTFCQDNSVNLRSTNQSGNLWNTGQSNQSITVDRSGEYFLKVKNEFGCESISEKIAVNVNPKPQKPIVSVDGPTVFCADTTVIISSDVLSEIQWNNGQTVPQLRIADSGDFFVTATNQFGCQEISNTITIKVNPIPQKPTISTGGPTIFCYGDSVNLAATQSVGYLWSNSRTEQNFNVGTSGVFSVKIRDENGCISPPSDEVSVNVKENPLNLGILKSGPYTLEALTNGPFDSKFEWYKDGIKLSKEEAIIKAKESGSYTLRGSIFYLLEDGTSLRCYSKISEPFVFQIDPSDNGARIFPNPATEDIVNIETLEDLEDVQITFYDMKGAILREYTVYKFDSRKTLKLANLPMGKYIVTIKNKDFSVLKRVFVERN